MLPCEESGDRLKRRLRSRLPASGTEAAPTISAYERNTVLIDAATHSGDPPQVVDFMQSPLQACTELIERLVGDRLAGLTAYGAVLDADFDVARMTATCVLVLREIDLSLLRRLAEHGPKLGAKHMAAPIVMTPAYISASLDTFPLELLEIHQHHKTLAGDDHFADMEIQPEHLRLQCEREFKRILIRLRQGLLAAAGREQVLEELQIDVGQHVMRAARGLLWLKGERHYARREEVLDACRRLASVSLDGVRNALDLYGEHGPQQFDAIYHDVERLARVADEL